MLLLPPITVSGSPLRLPCPSADLIRLCSIVSGETNRLREHVFTDSPGVGLNVGQSSELEQLLNSSPSLLVYLLAQYESRCGQCVETIQELGHWVFDDLFLLNVELDALSPSEFELLSFEDLREVNSACRKFLSQPTAKRLAKYVAQTARFEVGDRPKKKELIHWVTNGLVHRFQFSPLNDSEILQVMQAWPDQWVLDVSSVGAMLIATSRFVNLTLRFRETLESEKLKSLKQLAYGASHEINNPLANVATRAQSLLTGETNPERRRLISLIYDQAMRAHDMISDMMLFARPPQVELEPTDLKEFSRTVVSEMESTLDSSGISIRIHQYPDVVPIPIDRTQMLIALEAVIQNSIDSIGNSGEIRIRLFRACEKMLGLSIIDDGPGIAAEHASHLFDPFFSGREAGRGLGFGLSKAWRIVSQHSGHMFCDSDYTDGAKFEIRLPISQKVGCRIDIARAA